MEIVVASGKGGVGKSTVSSTLAIELHKKYDLVAIDADADAPNLHLILGIEKWDEEEPLISASIAKIDYDRCTDCGLCMDVCTYDAIKLLEGRYVINELICEGCRTCQYVCPDKAISIRPVESGIVRRAVTKYGFPLISARLHVGKANTGKLVTREKDLAKELDKAYIPTRYPNVHPEGAPYELYTKEEAERLGINIREVVERSLIEAIKEEKKRRMAEALREMAEAGGDMTPEDWVEAVKTSRRERSA